MLLEIAAIVSEQQECVVTARETAKQNTTGKFKMKLIYLLLWPHGHLISDTKKSPNICFSRFSTQSFPARTRDLYLEMFFEVC